MTKEFNVAHIKEQGKDLIIVPLDGAHISPQSSDTQQETRDILQLSAQKAGLKGTVCLVWMSGSTFCFLAPQLWHPFFRSIDMDFVKAHLNRKLTISYSDEL